MKKSISFDSIICFIAIVSLFFTVTNFVPISAVISVSIILIPLYVLGHKCVIPKYFKWLILLFAFAVCSSLIYNPKQLLEIDFYRRDGNLFITYAPLLILSITKMNINVEKLFLKYISFSTYFNLLFLIIWLMFGTQFANYEYGICHFGFIAHNAAGGFISTVLAMCIGYFIEKKDKKILLYIFINIINLWFSASRGSMIGIGIGSLIYLMNKKSHIKRLDFKIIVLITVFMFALEFILLFYMIRNGESTAGIVNLNSGFLPTYMYNTPVKYITAINRGGTIILRMFALWPRAALRFLYSPIIGNGFGSYNDIVTISNSKFREINVFEFINSDGHAHNTFFNFAAETGIVGLILLFMFLYHLREYIIAIEDKRLSNALHIAYLSIIISSFTEHRLTTPSQVLPFVIITGLAVAKRNYVKEKNNNENSLFNEN